jgi:hypothetical protein
LIIGTNYSKVSLIRRKLKNENKRMKRKERKEKNENKRMRRKGA